jgi:hypothetical protein
MRLAIFIFCAASAIAQTLLQQNYDTRSFHWSRTNGLGASGNLSSPGTGKVISLTPPPKGVYGSSGNHYVYIYDGTGTAESALITGGTCSSSSLVSCTIIVTTANTHAGTWKVGTATAGIQETINVMGASGGEVYIPAGDHYTYAPVYVSRGYVSIRGAGMHSSLIHNQTNDSSDVFVFNHASLGFFNSVSDIGFFCPQSGGVATKAGGAVISLRNQAYFYAMRVYAAYIPVGIHSVDSGWVLDEINLRELKPSTGIGLVVDGGGAFDNYVRHMTADSGAEYLAGIQVISTGYLAIDRCDLIHATHDLLVNPTSLSRSVYSMDVIGTYFDTSYTSGITISPSGTGYVGRSRFIANWTSSSAVGPGVNITASDSAVVEDLYFLQHQAYLNAHQGMAIVPNGGTIRHITIDGAQIGSNSYGSPNTWDGIAVGAGVDGLSILNSQIGVYAGGGQRFGVVLFTGATDNLLIKGNDLRDNTTGPMLDLATGVNKIIKDNLGVDNATPSTVASAASIAMPTQSVAYVSGTTQITTITGGWKGREITLIFTSASPGGVGTGGNIARAQTAAQNQAIRLTFDGTNWY